MTYVVDASVGVKWALSEVDSDKAIRLRDDYLHFAIELRAPDVFSAEIAHAIARAERRGIISFPHGAIHLADILRTLPLLHPILPDLLPRAYIIAATARIGVYDCLYVAFAERECCELITADLRLIGNLGNQFPFIRPLSSFP